MMKLLHALQQFVLLKNRYTGETGSYLHYDKKSGRMSQIENPLRII